MAWDSSRPVPWRRLTREWVIYVAAMAVVFVVFFRDQSLLGMFIGLFVSGPLYLLLGAVLAKFGYQRRTLREARDATRAARAGAGPTAGAGARVAAAPARPKPAPTKRTGGASGRPGGQRKR